ncbi:hypothetical protein SF123566_2052 [Shigella flexneri 1235-66]|nr:hypothetical protein SF123566_2052 [Shigella flexneri 1235-66]
MLIEFSMNNHSAIVVRQLNSVLSVASMYRVRSFTVFQSYSPPLA